MNSRFESSGTLKCFTLLNILLKSYKNMWKFAMNISNFSKVEPEESFGIIVISIFWKWQHLLCRENNYEMDYSYEIYIIIIILIANNLFLIIQNMKYSNCTRPRLFSLWIFSYFLSWNYATHITLSAPQ